MKNSNKAGKINPKVKEVLKILGAGTFLAASFVMPGATGVVLKEYEQHKREKDEKEWRKFNLWRLRETIKRLNAQKIIEVKEGVIEITEKGRKKLLKFNLDDMDLGQKTDGKWRIIIYDISESKKKERDFLREILKRMKFLKLQRSIYLTPFICEDEIEYLKQMFGVGDEVKILKITGIDNEQAYKEYFGI